jgi:hypothetical protein
MAITSIAGILVNYDSDKKIPCFGFGASPKFEGMFSSNVSHCFPLSGNYQNNEATGLENLISMYRNAVKHVSLSGPTYFGEILTQAIQIAAQSKAQGKKAYHTLLILTDG